MKGGGCHVSISIRHLIILQRKINVLFVGSNIGSKMFQWWSTGIGAGTSTLYSLDKQLGLKIWLLNLLMTKR